ncbi:unnamed protein product [Paramecium octaurelia]|uniref:Uncharacterized protein n=1 Tax=Paramecium octaurelia TaxID=43137 RepID=A0A8S1WCS4_PAROT|nr:unnamed protein product [Paramecium octaurelia]
MDQMFIINVNYSFFEELDKLINQMYIGEFDYKLLITQLTQLTSLKAKKQFQSQMISNNLNRLKSVNNYQQIQTLSINNQAQLKKVTQFKYNHLMKMLYQIHQG